MKYKIDFKNEGFDVNFQPVRKTFTSYEQALSYAIAYAGQLFMEVNMAYKDANIVMGADNVCIVSGNLSMIWTIVPAVDYELNSYVHRGITDSDKEGWYDEKGDTSSIEVSTPAGKIIALVAPDPSYPGICIDYQAKGDDYARQIARIDFTPDDEHGGGIVKARLWGDNSDDETFEDDGESYTFSRIVHILDENDEIAGQQSFLDVDNRSANERVLERVDMALRDFAASMLSVDLDDETRMININVCGRHNSYAVYPCVAEYEELDIAALTKELDKRNVGHCW